MIESININGIVPYHGEPMTISSLGKFNCFFGANGSGKSTLANVISNPSNYPHQCNINWDDGVECEVRIFNKEFVKVNFEESETVDGVSTIGEDSIEAQNIIGEKRKELNETRKLILEKTKLIHCKEDGTGYSVELEKLEKQFSEKCWNTRSELISKLKEPFHKTHTKHLMLAKVLSEAEIDSVGARSLEELTSQAALVFDDAAFIEPNIEKIDFKKVVEFEGNEVLEKAIIGRKDVNFGKLILKLQNSNWVRAGMKYCSKEKDVCPFCQTPVDSSLSKNLTEFFSEEYESNCLEIKAMEQGYREESRVILEFFHELAKSREGKLENDDRFSKLMILLDSLIKQNIRILERKISEPSSRVQLESIQATLKQMEEVIDAENQRISESNQLIQNRSVEKEKLTREIWKYIINERLQSDIQDFQSNKNSLRERIDRTESDITNLESRVSELEDEIGQAQTRIVSIEPTVNEINRTLRTNGFEGFYLQTTECEKFYRVIRPNGSNATTSLSEGELRIVAFLYFIHLVRGANVPENCVLVFDDPISSMDSESLFLVSMFVKDMIEEARGGEGKISQVFLLTHNVFFHKQVNERLRKPKASQTREVVYWMIRKDGTESHVERKVENPVNNTYELLWSEFKRPGQSSQMLQNVMRRIIESYFIHWGKWTWAQLCDQFSGDEEKVCRSFIRFLNEGSHSVFDDTNVTVGDDVIRKQKQMFKRVFYETGHKTHYKMMAPEAHA